MTNLVPGFIWQPVEVNGRAARRKGRGLIGHVAVSGATNLPPSGPSATRNADWHFYLPKTGPGFQYIDLDLQCWASMAGNASMAAFESQGGLGTADQVNAEPWTPDQVENAARILAHMAETEGVPLQDMGNSLPASRGFGVHRYGIDPWRVPGGELWSNPGKLCPGNAKVAQVPVIVSRANEIVHGSPTPPPPTVREDDMLKLIRTPDGTIWTVTDTEVLPAANLAAANSLAKTCGPWVDVSFADKDAIYLDADTRRKARLKAVQSYVLGADPGPDPTQWLFPRLVALQAEVSQVQAPTLDDAALAKIGAAVAASPGLAQGIVAALDADLAARFVTKP